MARASLIPAVKHWRCPRLARGSFTLFATAPRPPRASRPRRGATLIELIVVVSLLVILAAIAIPSLNLAVGHRGIREAARNLNVYLGAARNRAMATGRPVGVALQRFENEPNVCFVLDRVEGRPPYAGETVNSRARVRAGAGGIQAEFDGGFNPGRVRAGDRVQFDHQGPWYRIVNLAGQTATLTVSLADGQYLPWPADGSPSLPVPYQVQRQPLTDDGGFYVAMTRPVQLPIDSVIDLGFSGTESAETGFASGGNMSPVVIMFSPSGGIDSIYVGGDRYPVTEPVFLLVGKRERIPPGASEDGRPNWQDLDNLWVAVSPQTGLVNTVEVAPGDTLAASRQWARQAETMGGR